MKGTELSWNLTKGQFSGIGSGHRLSKSIFIEDGRCFTISLGMDRRGGLERRAKLVGNPPSEQEMCGRRSGIERRGGNLTLPSR